MAYTPLTTQIAGGTASAAGWANVVKANFESMGPHLIVRKTSDQTTTSLSPINDTQLLIPILANEVWHFRFVMILTGVDHEFGVAFPAGGALISNWFGIGGSQVDSFPLSGTTSPATSTGSGLGSSAPQGTCSFIEGIFTNGGTAGDLQLQFSSHLSGTTTMKANSTAWGVKIA